MTFYNKNTTQGTVTMVPLIDTGRDHTTKYTPLRWCGA